MISPFLRSCSPFLPALQLAARFRDGRNGNKVRNNRKPPTLQAWLHIARALANALQRFSTCRHLSRSARAARPASLAVSARESALLRLGSRLSSTAPTLGRTQ